MYRFEGTDIKMLVFITEVFSEKYPFFTTFLCVDFFEKSIISELWIIDVLRGIRKNKFTHNKRAESLRLIIEHREKEKDYFLKIKYNFKRSSKIEKLVKITIAFTLKTICKVIVSIIKFP